MMRVSLLPDSAFMAAVGALMLLAMQPAAASSRLLDPGSRAADGCCRQTPASTPAPRIVTHTPWIEDRGLPTWNPEVRILFDGALEPGSVHEGSVRIGYRDRFDQYQTVPATVALEGGRIVAVRPHAQLWSAVYYEVQVQGGEDGVRALRGHPLPADYRWRFATQVEFHPRPDHDSLFMTRASSSEMDRFAPQFRWRPVAVNWQDCAKPAEGDGLDASTSYIVVHVYQSSCDAPLLPGKTSLIQVYGAWAEKSNVDEENQVTWFEADVEFRHEGVSIGTIGHRFTRPDEVEPEERRLGTHTANLFGWTPAPAGNQANSYVEVIVKPKEAKQSPGQLPRLSLGRRDFDWAIPRKRRDQIWLEIFTFDFKDEQLADLNWDPATEALVREVGDESVEFISQMFPVLDTVYVFHGIGSITVPKIDTETMAAGSDAFLSYLHMRLRTTANRLGLRKHRYVPVGVVRHAALPPNVGGQAIAWVPGLFSVQSGSALTTPSATPLAHEVGHFYGLDHCPGGGDDPMRTTPCIIEGYRLDRHAGTGSNKSAQEGNEQNAVLEPFMFWSRTIADPDTQFISMDSYRRLLPRFTRWKQSTQQAMAPLPPGIGRPRSAFAARLAAWSPLGIGGPALADAPLAGGWNGTEPLRHTLAQARQPVAVPPDRAPTAVRDGVTELLIYGFVRRDGSDATIEGVYPLDPFEDDDDDGVNPEATSDQRVPGVAVEFVDAAGNVLARIPMTTMPDPAHGTFDDDVPRPFVVHLPGSPDGAQVVVRGPAGVLAEHRRSPSSPVVTLLSPKDGATLKESGEIRWSGSDADGDELTYDVMARQDFDDDWTLLVSETRETSLNVANAPIYAGSAPELRVVATDGFNVSAPASARVRVRRPLQPLATTPGSNADAVHLSAVPRASFAAQLDADSVTPRRATLRDASGATVPAAVSLDETGMRVHLTPEQPLRAGSTYTARLARGIADRWGNKLARDYEWSFTTAADQSPPWVRESIPAPGALTVRTDAPVRIVFSEPLDPASADSASFRVQNAAGASVAGSVSWEAESQSLVFRPANPLALQTVFAVTVEGARDEAGNELPEPYSFTFTTAGSVLPLVRPDGGGR